MVLTFRKNNIMTKYKTKANLEEMLVDLNEEFTAYVNQREFPVDALVRSLSVLLESQNVHSVKHFHFSKNGDSVNFTLDMHV